MRYMNRSIAHRGSKRRVRALKARDYWSRDMTALVAIVVGVLVLMLYQFL